VFDLLRPQTPALWGRLDTRNRRRFIRHLRPFWDVHRHRAAPEIHREISELIERGSFRILRTRETDRSESYDLIIDCTGLIRDVRQSTSPLVRSLLAKGLVELDDPPLGIDSTTHAVHVIGPLLRGALWESVAIPEIRLQAHDLAKKLQ
jgi:uncharacterized NAD(P)/FAD-binding protein YdhS